MNRKKLGFVIVSDKPIDYEDFCKNELLINKLNSMEELDKYYLTIGCNDENILQCRGFIISYTKKELDAEYTLFKKKYVRIMKEHYKNLKFIDAMKLYSDLL